MLTDPIIDRARKKAAQSICKFYVAAIGFNKSGIPIMARSNRPRFSKYGGGYHAERLIMEQAKQKGITSIVICRIGRSGKLRPIEPCENCSKIAKKLGIRLETIPDEQV